SCCRAARAGRARPWSKVRAETAVGGQGTALSTLREGRTRVGRPVGRSASFRPPSAVCTEALTGGQREALTTLRSGARPQPRPADKNDVVRPTNLRSTPCLCLMQGGRRLSGRRVRCAPKPCLVANAKR